MPKKGLKEIINTWPKTNPSSSSSSIPLATNDKLQHLVDPHLKSFNYIFEEGLDAAIEHLLPMTLQLPNSSSKMTLWIENAQILYPAVKPSTSGSKMTKTLSDNLLPTECRQRKLSYTAPLVVTLGYRIDDEPSQHIQRSVGDLPIMVRSRHCHLHQLSPEQLVCAREEATEMGGYFICNGNERCVRMLQMPRRHHMMAVKRSSYQKRGNLYTDLAVFMRCVRRDQTAVTVTMHYLVDGQATVRFGVHKQEFMIPVVLMLKALGGGNMSDREIFERVVRDEDASNSYLVARVELILREAKAQFSHVSTREDALVVLGTHFQSVLPYLSDDMSPLDIGNRLVDEYLMVHIPKGEKGRAQKTELMILMLRKLYAFAKGSICADNPDSVMNHELLLPGHLYLMVLKEKLQDQLQTLKHSVARELKDLASKSSNKSLSSNSVIPDHLMLKKMWERTPNIGHGMNFFLNTGNLKTSSGLDLMQIAGYTIVAEKLNFYRYFSHFRSVHRGQFFTTMKTTAIRKLLPDSWGFLCPVHTPDGSPCGLLNHLAVECQVITCPSVNAAQEDEQLGQLLTSYGMTPTNGYSDGALTMPAQYLPIMLNGKVLGVALAATCEGLARMLRQAKVAGASDETKPRTVDPTLEVCWIAPIERGPFPGLFLSTDCARMIRPVQQLVTTTTKSKTKQTSSDTRPPVIEYIGAMEQVFMDIACTAEDVHAATTHIELDPMNMLSLVASLTPFSDHNQSPRNMYQCQMAKQTMGTPCHSIAYRNDNKMYRIQTPQAPLVQNQRLRDFQLDEYPLGTNAVVAVISYTGYDMEDAMILNKNAYHRGFGHASVYKHQVVDITPEGKNSSSKNLLYFSNVNANNHNLPFTSSLDLDGLPSVGQVLNYGDVIACYVNATTGEPEYVKHKEQESAIVDQISILQTSDANSTLIQKIGLKLRFCRNPVVGDKFSSRHGQKGVMSILWPQEDMPFSESGMTPDIIINPHAFPSRMTIGMLIESMAAKAGALNGSYHDATPFRKTNDGRKVGPTSEKEKNESLENPASKSEEEEEEDERVIDYFGKQLRTAGYNYMGSEPLYSGLSGTVMQADIYMGVVYYQRLRHMVSDKSQVRATGPTNSLTRQPVKGRKKRGGIRFGEMERDSLLAHGCAFLLHDRLMNCSDKHIAVVCTACGSLLSTLTQRSSVESAGQAEIATYLQAKNQWTCATCKSGDACEAVAMPYVFRYLVNELAGMNIKLTLALKSC